MMNIEQAITEIFENVTDDEQLQATLTALYAAEAQLYDGEGEEFLQKSILFGRCDEAHFRLMNTDKMIHETGVELKQLLAGDTSSEVADTKVQAKINFLTNLRHQRELYQLRLDAAVEAHDRMMDEPWTPRAQRNKTDTKSATAARAEAVGLLRDIGIEVEDTKAA